MTRMFVARLSDGRLRASLQTIVILALAIFVAALAGSLSRPLGFLAAFWPANALLAGVLVRFGKGNRLAALLGAFAGYMLAAYMVGDAFWMAIRMTAANMLGAGVFAFLYCSFEPEKRALSRPRGVLVLVVGALVCSAAAAMIGGPVWAELGNVPYYDGWMIWFAAEWVNYLALLPVLLTMPWPLFWPDRAAWRSAFTSAIWMPLGAVAVSVGLSLIVLHPLAIAFPVPALVWCALILPVPATCVLVLLYAGVAMMGFKLGLFGLAMGQGLSDAAVASVHLGIAFIALGPVLVASANHERRQHIARLEKAARFDALTEALTRSAFMDEGERLMQRLRIAEKPVTVFLVDADRFKQVNDNHGHAAGDRALVAISAAIRRAVRQGDLFGRLGGEEFALMLPDTDYWQAEAIARRLRCMVERLEIGLDGGEILKITVSVGVVIAAPAEKGLTEMVSLADAAMYEAKRAGRNRIAFANPAESN